MNKKRSEAAARRRVKRLIPPLAPEFDGREPVEVIQLMSRAKQWLEARGYKIELRGTYTQIKQVKF